MRPAEAATFLEIIKAAEKRRPPRFYEHKYSKCVHIYGLCDDFQ
jgi:hypothetical protein